jgi:hypothetical protein
VLELQYAVLDPYIAAFEAQETPMLELQKAVLEAYDACANTFDNARFVGAFDVDPLFVEFMKRLQYPKQFREPLTSRVNAGDVVCTPKLLLLVNMNVEPLLFIVNLLLKVNCPLTITLQPIKTLPRLLVVLLTVTFGAYT